MKRRLFRKHKNAPAIEAFIVSRKSVDGSGTFVSSTPTMESSLALVGTKETIIHPGKLIEMSGAFGALAVKEPVIVVETVMVAGTPGGATNEPDAPPIPVKVAD